MDYTHAQSNPMLGMALGAVGAVALVLGLAASAPAAIVGGIVLLLVGALGYSLSKLAVTVTSTAVEVAFRFGWPKKVIPLGDILRAEPVRNKAWYGWGVRWIPGGSLWNVWGLDAVALSLASGRQFRIGTDEPEALAAAIAAAAPDAGVDSCWGV